MNTNDAKTKQKAVQKRSYMRHLGVCTHSLLYIGDYKLTSQGANGTPTALHTDKVMMRSRVVFKDDLPGDAI